MTGSRQDVSPAKRFFFARVFPSIFALIGAGVLIWGVSVVLEGSASSDWPSTDGVVTSSQVATRTDSSRNRSRTSYVATVTYDYAVAGRTFTGDRIAADAGHGSGDVSNAREIVNRYPEGASVKVYYRPDDPSEAVLERGVPGRAWGPIAIGGVFLIVGVAMFIFMPRLIDGGQVRFR